MKFFFVQNGWIQNGRIPDGCHPQVEWEWMSELFLFKMAESKKQNSRWADIFKWVRMNEFESDWISLSQSFVQNGWIKEGRIQDDSIQDGCHHQVKWEWMSLSQIELVWVRVRVEWGCFWVNLREDNKVSESKMAVAESNPGRIQDSCHLQVESEWMSQVYFVQNCWIQNGRIQDG